MTDDFITGFTSPRAPGEVFEAINDVRGWWSGEIEGPTAALGDVFTYRHGDVHRSVQRITESVPGSRIVWHVDEGYLAFAEDHAEWTGTDIVFDLAPAASGGTEVRFTHVGLAPQLECFGACSSAWAYYVGDSLRAFVGTTAG